jgi:hypothetical protein
LEVIMGVNGGLARRRTLQNVASVYKKLERLTRLAGFLG